MIRGKLAKLVRDRALNRCEYCQVADGLCELPHQYDHVIPQKHAGETRESNLALACFYCNRYKGSDLAGIDPETGQIITLFNPRMDDWTQHFKWNGPHLVGITSVGRATVRTLQINHPLAVELRRLRYS